MSSHPFVHLLALFALSGCGVGGDGSKEGYPGDTDTDTDTEAVTDPDGDGDGVTVAGGDCDDADPTVNPGAEDRTVDGRDQDCDDIDGPDQDGDGFVDAAAGGDDCDDGTRRPSPAQRRRGTTGSTRTATASPMSRTRSVRRT
ncbi:MAG: putative metal-binding motif-containing protein [Pseudomonadota bacterium]|nr:putative metal-binding motif-containing protein [Pseudomonadota bacterium]